MKLLIFLLLVIALTSCSTLDSMIGIETRYSNKGETSEEKLYYRIQDSYELGNYNAGLGQVRAFERRYPNSKNICEVVSFKGDTYAKSEYWETAIEHYQFAKKKCLEVNDDKRVKVLEKKIEDMVQAIAEEKKK